MPAYSLQEIMSQATWRAGRRSDLDMSMVSFLANEAYMEVAQAIPHALLEKIAVSSTTSGENRITLPSDFGEPIHFSLLSVNGSAQTLRAVDVARADEEQATRVGTPDSYTLFSNWVELWPSPSSAWSLQLRYRSAATDMTALTDVPSISTPWRSAIVVKLEEKLHTAVGNVQGAAIAQERYLALTSTLKTDLAKRQSTSHPQGVRVLYD